MVQHRSLTAMIPAPIVIGAGHNGLTAAAYLLEWDCLRWWMERRGIVGGCCTTAENAPDRRASTTSYIASMLRPEGISELRLADYGLWMIPYDRTSCQKDSRTWKKAGESRCRRTSSTTTTI
jgi:phytoene dehydrogenase-like protein